MVKNMAQTAQKAKPETGNTERIRGPNLKVLVKRADGVSYRKALELADKNNLVLAPNKRMTKALVETDEWKSMREAFACWTGTMTGYIEPGKKLGKFIEYTDPEDGQKYVFPVPEQYRNEKNMILVVEHPNFTLVQDGKNLVIEASEVVGLTHFPKENGWYLGDEQFDIPTGKEVSSSDEKARYLWRVDSRVGPVARGDYGDYDGRYALLYGPSGRIGVVVESPEGGALANEVRGASEASLPTAPKIAQVENTPDESGVLVKGVTAEELRALVGNAKSSLEELVQTVREEKLEPLARLVESLRIKE
jgi:hypothetical protein